MNFIHFWRLVKEKGFDLVVESLSRLATETDGLPGNFYIFGEGDLKALLLEKFSGDPFFEDASKLRADAVLDKVDTSSLPESEARIYFFGWQEQETIRRVLEISHFCLMPSRFLETFGLSALESLAEGVPVIGFSKGGLTPFILPELAVPFSNDESNIRALTEVVIRAGEYEWVYWKKLSDTARHIAERYTEDVWMDKVRLLLSERNGDAKKILLMSDYTTILGGIETHVHNIARVLRSRGYEVEIFGWAIKKGKWTRAERLLGLVLSCYNFVFARRLRKKLETYQPDIVWLHSVSRFLGPLCVKEVVKTRTCHSLVTYHDLGLWSAYPSIIEREDMIPLSGGYSSFAFALHTRNPIKHAAVFCKYVQTLLLKKHLRKIDTHLVPSRFLIQYVRDISKIPETRIEELSHFL